MFKLLLKLTLLVAGCFVCLLPESAAAQTKETPRYQVSVCDWMILKRQKLGEFQLAHELGCDGIEVDMGGLGRRDTFDNKLRYTHFQKLFKAKAREYGVTISSIAMSGFFGQSFAAHANYRGLVQDCLATMQAMGVRTAYLPLGVCDPATHPELRPELVRRLKEVGDMAAAVGCTIGIETSLDAQGHLDLLRDIASPGIKVYYKFQNALESGRDVCRELETIGTANLCPLLHCTDTDGVTLDRNTRLDLPRVKATLDRMGWRGWLVMERSRDTSDVHNVKRNYGTNAAYLKKVFQSPDSSR